MLKSTKTFVVVCVLGLITACGGGGGGSSSDGGLTKTTFAANLRSATAAGIANQSGTTVASINSFSIYALIQKLFGINDAVAQASNNTVQQSIAVGDFVSIDGNGNVARIFNYSFPIYSIKTTTNYLIVSGSFISPLDTLSGVPLIVDKSGNALKCYLYAIKKTATGSDSDITCLSDVKVGSYSITESQSNAHYAHLGFETRGVSAYYTDWAGGKLYKWTEGNLAGSILFQQTPVASTVGMDDVFIDANGSNICVLYSALSLGNNSVYYGDVYCGTDAGLSSKLVGDINNSVLAETRSLGKYLIAGTKKIDLTTLAVTATTTNGSNYGLPSGNANIYVTASGQTIQRAYAWSLSTMDTNGNTCLLATTNGLSNTGCTAVAQTVSSYFQTVIGLGSYTWAYGTTDPHDTTTGNYLAKIDNSTIILSGTNYLSSTGLASISDLSFTTDGKIVVTGKDSSGNAKYAYIDSSGTITSSNTSPTFRLASKVSL